MKIINRKAFFDYTITDRFEAGIQLTGAEVKSVRGGHGKLEGSFVRIIGSEAYLINAQIFPYIYARLEGYDPKRTRKLLLHKKEIVSLKSKIEGANLTLIPLSWYNSGPLIKLEVGLARGKKKYEKREAIKREDQKRELEQEFRGKIK
ncbi:SsrA-binding protein SmpB [Patescibacteria group bacterium]|nr:SsrA-binding protein SmpB [Patescibacteria group bacterium]MBU1472210.1 SsrA-binding protein SmpB [Patescibacteria group bacterium]MBU2459604.1 SsrA-binding protein SmpB [Patescibacteria group bacterium]MBU2544524.1 SsrA-binding protein SmpB [Patescibacteria group bacterium]